MKPFDILQGDSLEVLRTLPDGSVNCCVTSPPYYGLRDYGTATWEGGDPECPHKNLHGVQTDKGERAGRTFTGAQNYYKEACGKCGAVRIDQQIGLERTPEEFVAKLVAVFLEVRRVLRDDGTLWVNIGDSYASTPPGNKTEGVSASSTLHGVNGVSGAYRETLKSGHATKRDTSKIPGLKPKDLIGVPWMLAFALRSSGWYLRQDIIWHKPNPMPESVRDRCTKAHEYVFLLSKSQRYWYDAAAISDRAIHAGKTVILGDKSLSRGQANGAAVTPSGNGKADSVVVAESRNRRSVWSLATQATPEAHFATFPLELPELCIKAGCPEGGTVLDPFAGAGTTGLACLKNGRNFIGIELNPAYIEIANTRARKYYPLLMEAAS